MLVLSKISLSITIGILVCLRMIFYALLFDEFTLCYEEIYVKFASVSTEWSDPYKSSIPV